jgi:hypothetical protein
LIEVARVFFDLNVANEWVRDEEGVEFKDVADAKADAAAALHEMVAADIEAQLPVQPRSIIIRDEHGTTLVRVKMRGYVEMVQDTP